MNKYQKQLSKEIKQYNKEVLISTFTYEETKELLKTNIHKEVICNDCNSVGCREIKNKRLICSNITNK